MNKSALITLIVLVLLGIGAYFVWGRDNTYTPIPNQNSTTTTPNYNATTTPNTTATTSANVRVTYPLANGTVGKSFTVTGEARKWYFEGSFPIEVVDANGNRLAQGIAQAQGDWMTSNFVPFKAPITLSSTPTTQTGTIILRNDNPSGLPELSEEFRVPVRFSSTGASNTPIQDAVRALLTKWNLPGVSLVSASLTNGILTLTFSDPQFKTSGGSARVTQYRNEIFNAVKQYGVTDVRYKPNEVFQP